MFRAAFRRTAWLACFYTLVINIAVLVLPIYMLQVYDRVLTSGSLSTLMFLSLAALVSLLLYGLSEAGRRQVFAVTANRLDLGLANSVIAEPFGRADRSPGSIASLYTDVSRVRSALHGGLLGPLFDLPFTPLMIAVLFAISPVLGLVGLGGVALSVALAWMAGRQTAERIRQAEQESQNCAEELHRMVQHRSAVNSMGMAERVMATWQDRYAQSNQSQFAATVPGLVYSSTSRAARIGLQVAMLGTGAWLAIEGAVSAGVVVAGSIILGRALAPIDQVIGSWRQLVLLRQSYETLVQEAGASEDRKPASPASVDIRPEPILEFEHLEVGFEGSETSLLKPVNVALPKATIMAIVGPSGSGKTTLIETIVGARNPLAGKVRLGGRDIALWPSAERGPYVGYLPQFTEFLPGTVAENISRFRKDFDGDAVLHAASQVGVTPLFGTYQRGTTHLLAQKVFGCPAGKINWWGWRERFLGPLRWWYWTNPRRISMPTAPRDFSPL